MSGGSRALLEIGIIILKNFSISYPIRNLEECFPGVVYRSIPTGWMDSNLFAEWLGDKRIFIPLSAGWKRFLWLKNCKMTPEVSAALHKSCTEFRLFQECATELLHTSDSFGIQAIKVEWKKRWDSELMRMIELKSVPMLKMGQVDSSARLINYF